MINQFKMDQNVTNHVSATEMTEMKKISDPENTNVFQADSTG